VARLLLSHNPVYWPSVGGSERVLQHVLEGVRGDFDRVAMFTTSTVAPFDHNGIEVHPYTAGALRRFAIRERPDVYFPNIIHNRITYKNIAWVSRWSQRTILNVVGGYLPGASLRRRLRMTRLAARHADVLVHVDPLSTEWLVDRTLVRGLPVLFIPQGLDLEEIDEVRSERGEGYFVYAHNLWRWKQPDVFLRRVVEQAPELNFKMIASAKSGDVIDQTLTTAATLPNVEVLLGLDRVAFLRAIARAAAVISTSAAEGAQPNIMLEAGALGVPYLSLCPGQNFAHYPHVEMFANVDALVDRLRSLGPRIRQEKATALAEARATFSADHYGWDAVVSQFHKLFLGKLPPLASEPSYEPHLAERVRTHLLSSRTARRLDEGVEQPELDPGADRAG
jgi:glycosyltransferase involved in cell wall biosynthesis